MNYHPSLPSSPEMELSISAGLRDCLSRQIGAALCISNSKDTLLNSKAEYMANSVCTVTMKEDPWEQRERTRKEKEQEEIVKKQVEEFKKIKSTQQLQQIPTDETVTVSVTEPCVIQDNSAKQDMETPDTRHQTQPSVTGQTHKVTD